MPKAARSVRRRDRRGGDRGEDRHRRRDEDALRLDWMRVSIEDRVAALGRGDFTEVEGAGLDAWLDDLTPTTSR